MNPDTALQTINYAASQSDRWLFVALIVIGLFAIWILFRYFTGRIDRLQERMDFQTEEFVSHLKQANAEMLAVLSSAKAVIERVERHLTK
jgi:type VI protein secretion system component VasK